jgi:hypothetical protein
MRRSKRATLTDEQRLQHAKGLLYCAANKVQDRQLILSGITPPSDADSYAETKFRAQTLLDVLQLVRRASHT